MSEDIEKVLENLTAGEHICSIYRDAEEQLSLIIPFIKRGLENNEKCLYIVDERTSGEVAAAFRRSGIDLRSYIKSGQFEFLTAEEAYLRGGCFDPDRMIELLKESEKNALEEGYSGLRVTGEMSWVLRRLPGVERLIEYEVKLNRFFPESRTTAICQYNEGRFEPEILLDVIHTHPRVVIYGTLCRNHYYIPPEELLARIGGRLNREVYERVRDDILARSRREGRRRRAEEELREKAEKLALLSDMVAEIGQELDYDSILAKAARKAAELVEAETVAIPIVDENHSTISYPAAYGLHADRLIGRSKPLKMRSICGWVIRNKKPFFSEDITKDPRESEDVKRLFNLRTAISAPLMYKDRVFGGITALNKRGGGMFTRSDLQLLCIFASNVAVSLHNALLLREVKSYAEQLRRSNQLKDLFIDIMQHDLLTPVSVIRGVVDVMLEDMPESRDLKIIKRSADRLVGMIENAAKLSRLESGEKLVKRELNLKKVIDSAVEDSRQLIESAGMRVDNRVTGDLPVEADPIIVDVFLNLLSNAAKYASEGGRVIIEAVDEGDSYRIMVRDFGPGIPDPDKEEIFNRFVRREKEGIRGTGLGLAIARRIVELHNGRIWVEDNSPRGAVFCVRLPKLKKGR